MRTLKKQPSIHFPFQVPCQIALPRLASPRLALPYPTLHTLSSPFPGQRTGQRQPMTTYSYLPYQTAASARTNTRWASRFYSGGAVLALLLSTLPRRDAPGARARDIFSALSGRRGSVGGIGTGWESMLHHLALPAPNVRASFVPCMERQLPTLSCTHKRGRMQCDERRDPWSGSNSPKLARPPGQEDRRAALLSESRLDQEERTRYQCG